MELRLDWKAPQAMKFYAEGTELSSILTIGGGAIDTQAATCKDHLRENFGGIGLAMLDVVQKAWNSKKKKSRLGKNTGDGLAELPVILQSLEGSGHEILVITASGEISSLPKVVGAFAWLRCAIRLASEEFLALSTFQFYLHTTRS